MAQWALFGAQAVLGYGAYKAERSAGKIARFEGETQAKAAELEATQREVDRKERLADALASQNATFAASGVSAFEGSPLTVMRADAERERRNTQRDRFSADLEAMTARYRGLIADKQSKSRATQNLIGSFLG